MNRGFVAATIVALAVLFSQGGGLVLAALCPHVRAETTLCHAAQQETAGTHHDTDHAQPEPAQPEPAQPEHNQVGSSPTQSTNAKGDALQNNESGGSCNHCAVHSRTKHDRSALQSTGFSQRTNETAISTVASTIGPPSVSKTIAWPAKAHGPPGNSDPLYLLINVFRI